MEISEYDKLLVMYGNEEQALMRKSLDAPLTEDEERSLESIYSRDESFVEDMMKEIGWPRKSLFSKEAAIFAFLFVQHSRKIKLQEKALMLMKSLPKDEVSMKNIAFLQDRILVRKNFTTVYANVSYTDGPDFNVIPLFDSELELDVRRQEAGLGHMREQIQESMRTFHKEKTIILESISL